MNRDETPLQQSFVSQFFNYTKTKIPWFNKGKQKLREHRENVTKKTFTQLIFFLLVQILQSDISQLKEMNVRDGRFPLVLTLHFLAFWSASLRLCENVGVWTPNQQPDVARHDVYRSSGHQCAYTGSSCSSRLGNAASQAGQVEETNLESVQRVHQRHVVWRCASGQRSARSILLHGCDRSSAGRSDACGVGFFWRNSGVCCPNKKKQSSGLDWKNEKEDPS